jgi:hypothetical protein
VFFLFSLFFLLKEKKEKTKKESSRGLEVKKRNTKTAFSKVVF